MSDDHEVDLHWRCPCGEYVLRVQAGWDAGVDRFLERAERHAAQCALTASLFPESRGCRPLG